MQFKDEVLKQIAEKGGNVAQFVSFSPHGVQRFSCIRGISQTKQFESIDEAVNTLLQSGSPFVNIRTFLPEKQDGNPFLMGRNGFETSQKVSKKVKELFKQGYYVIINGEIDQGQNDGGFSGVLLGDVAEFATRDTPRCVEKPGCAVLQRQKISKFVKIVYGHNLKIPYGKNYRVEFSVHPGPVGYRRQYQVIWQIELMLCGSKIPEPKPIWPNRVSEDMGDKAYGLLMAYLYGFLVPKTKVIGRFFPPFEFGRETGSPQQPWRRLCPRVPQPGRFTTKRGQLDPFALINKEDPDGFQISSLIFQDDVGAAYSGAAVADSRGSLIIEGKAGDGDDFMVGETASEKLPQVVSDRVRRTWAKASRVFGPVRFEWCFDKSGQVWLLQLHLGQTTLAESVIYPGKPRHFKFFNTDKGLRAFRNLIERAKKDKFGIILKGNVGITSHFSDLLWRNEIPSRLERS